MKLREVIEYASKIKPHSFDEETLTVWINECEGHIQTEVIGIAPVDVISYSYEENAETELILTPPHTKLYGYYLVAMIDFTHGEYQKYENTMKMYNACLDEFAKWFIRTHSNDSKIVSGYYLSAYGLAVKHGYDGTEEEWLKSLVGPQGEQGVQGEQGPKGDPGKVSSVLAGDNGYIVVDGEAVKVYDDSGLVLQIENAKQSAINAILGGTVDADFDTLKEVASWILSDTTKSAELIIRVSALEDHTVDKTVHITKSEREKLEGLKNYDDTELRLRDERLKYYGDPDVVPTDDSFFEFTTDDETMTAVARVLYNKEIEELVIPYEYVFGDKVYTIIQLTYIDTAVSYQNKSSVKKVIIPNASIMYIGDMVFSDTSITSIDIPECVSSINGQTFTDCSDLTNITLSKNISYISPMAFDGCKKLTINCAEGSYADTYAKENGINVEYTDEVTKQFVLNKIDENSTFIINATIDADKNITSDTTYDMIYDAYNSGKEIILKLYDEGSDTTISGLMSTFNDYDAQWVLIFGYAYYTATCNDTNGWSYNESFLVSENLFDETIQNYYTKKEVENYVDNVLGNIETELDNIITIQNELIGGDN